MTVILAEKPSQAKDYAAAFQKAVRKDGYFEINDREYFGDETVYLTWGIGHLVELVAPEIYKKEWGKWNLQDLPIFPESFQFQVAKDKKKQFNIVRTLLKEKATRIIVATDPDREGENIARSIIQLAGASHKPTERLWINSLEVDAIQKGFKNLKNGADYMNLYYEAETRQKSDWLVGINATRLYTILLQQKGMGNFGAFSAGRVQTPTLHLIYNRQAAIEQFKPSPFYELIGDVSVQNGTFEAKYNERFSQLQDAISLLRQNGAVEGENEGVIQSLEKSLKKTQAPKLHSLSTLQTKANKKWKYSPRVVLETVQALYEKKVVSYPRTSSQYITENEFAYLVERVDQYKALFDFSVDTTRLESNKRYVDGKRVQEHYAIVPTKQLATVSELNEREQNIYKEIVATTLGMFAPDYEYEQTTVEVAVHGIVFRTTGNVEVAKGWKVLFADEEKKDVKKEKEAKLPLVQQGETCTVFIKTKNGMTKAPKPYTEGDLINVMKKAGREIDDEEAQKVLKESEGIGTEATRGAIIESLKRSGYIEVKQNTVHVTEKGVVLCKAVEGTLLSSAELTAKWEQYLSLIGTGERTQQGFIRNIETFIKELISNANKSIEGMDTLISDMKKGASIGSCTNCEDGSIEDRGKFYGCTNYSNGCKFSLPKKWAGKTIPKGQIERLLKEKKTNLIKGFKSKKGNSFDAYLILKDGKIEMEFPKR